MGKIKQIAKQLLHNGRHYSAVVRGLARYIKTGETPPQAYQSMIHLYCRTQGRSNDRIHQLIRTFRRPYRLPAAQGVLGSLSSQEVSQIAQRVTDQGYHIYSQKLSDTICSQLIEIASTNAANLSPPRKGLPKQAIFDPQNPLSAGYRLPESTLVNTSLVQQLISDPSILAVAQAYLGCQPVLHTVNMWWSVPSSDPGDQSDLAQLYHFDMARVKWLKVFVYLTDVHQDNGAHCFIKRSHQTGQQPLEILKKGYRRIPDEEIRQHYSDESLVELTGPRGTIIFEDTRGLHKGKPLVAGQRLMFELDFADSLFGGAFERTPIEQVFVPQLEQFSQKFPRIYRKFQVSDLPSQPVAQRAA